MAHGSLTEQASLKSTELSRDNHAARRAGYDNSLSVVVPTISERCHFRRPDTQDEEEVTRAQRPWAGPNMLARVQT